MADVLSGSGLITPEGFNEFAAEAKTSNVPDIFPLVLAVYLGDPGRSQDANIWNRINTIDGIKIAQDFYGVTTFSSEEGLYSIHYPLMAQHTRIWLSFESSAEEQLTIRNESFNASLSAVETSFGLSLEDIIAKSEADNDLAVLEAVQPLRNTRTLIDEFVSHRHEERARTFNIFNIFQQEVERLKTIQLTRIGFSEGDRRKVNARFEYVKSFVEKYFGVEENVRQLVDRVSSKASERYKRTDSA